MVGAALCTAYFFLEFSSRYLEELAEEALDLTKYLLQLALSVGVRVEWIDRRHDGVQLQTTLWHVTSLPGGFYELLGGTFLQVLLAHDALKLFALLCIHVFLPLVGNLAIRRQTLNESVDEVFFVSQVWAGVDCLVDLDSQLGDVGTVALHLLHEEEDVVDVHLYLLHQLHLKLDVVVDVGLVAALCVLLCPVSQREVDARIVLQISLTEGVFLGKLVEAGKQVSYLQNAAEELDELLLVCIG